MSTLAEISDKIPLPRDYLLLGIVLGCACLFGTAMFAACARRFGLAFFVAFAALIAGWAVRVPPVDKGLAAQAEREIPGYHVRMYAALLAPLAPALLLALVAARVTPDWIRRSRRRERNACLSCGYSLEGLGTGACPECGCEHEIRARPLVRLRP